MKSKDNGLRVRKYVTPDQNVEVLCTSDERFLPHAATMLCSLLEHNAIAKVHFFHSSVSGAELEKLKLLLATYGTEIALYEINTANLERLRVDNYPMATYYRLLAPELLPPEVGKILYLDCDIIVRGPITDLWNVDIANKALVAVSNYHDEARQTLGFPANLKYFNAGVLLINLEYWRANNVMQRAISFVRNNPEKAKYPDQDALNTILIDQWVEVPARWNWQQWAPKPSRRSGIDPTVVHYVSSDKPWHWSNRHPFKNEYCLYRRKTPWRDYEQEGRPDLATRFAIFLKSFARAVLPHDVLQWLRARVASSQS